jgi:hypothetical protein
MTKSFNIRRSTQQQPPGSLGVGRRKGDLGEHGHARNLSCELSHHLSPLIHSSLPFIARGFPLCKTAVSPTHHNNQVQHKSQGEERGRKRKGEGERKCVLRDSSRTDAKTSPSSRVPSLCDHCRPCTPYLFRMYPQRSSFVTHSQHALRQQAHSTGAQGANLGMHCIRESLAIVRWIPWEGPAV